MCVFLVVRPFLWHQGQGCLSRSNIKLTFFQEMPVAEGIGISQTQLVLKEFVNLKVALIRLNQSEALLLSYVSVFRKI